MSEIQFSGSPLRMKAFDKLKVFLANPGKFCLIVLGSRGSGKHFAIEKAFREITNNADKALCLKELVFIDSTDIPRTATELNNLFKVNEGNTIVIEDVEELDEGQQKLLFKALSTKDGTFGIGESFDIRVVFTSSKDIDSLRRDNDLLIGLFWDRISQLVVEMPSFKDETNEVVKYFYATWRKMKFENTKGFEGLAGVPHNVTLENFLEDNAAKFEGGFRDLDKIACLYFNYRIFHYKGQKKIAEPIEKLVVHSVQDDFFSKSQMQGDAENDLSFYKFQSGFSHKELLRRYKIQLRKWAVKQYGSVANAEKRLGFGDGTLKNYTEKKTNKKP